VFNTYLTEKNQSITETKKWIYGIEQIKYNAKDRFVNLSTFDLFLVRSFRRRKEQAKSFFSIRAAGSRKKKNYRDRLARWSGAAISKFSNVGASNAISNGVFSDISSRLYFPANLL